MQTDKLKGLIFEKGYNVRSFSRAIEMPYFTLRDKLSGRTKFNIDEVQRVVDVLDLKDEPDRLVTIFFS